MAELGLQAGSTRVGKSASLQAGLLSGIALAAAVAALAFALRNLPGLGWASPMIIAVLLGIGINNIVGTPRWAKAGLAICLRKLLRFAIVLLGLQLTGAQIAAVGGSGLVVLVATVFATFTFTLWAGRLLKVEAPLTQLIAAGTSICGASAIVATNTVARGSDEDVAYAVACVTLFGTIAMLGFPLAAEALGLAAREYGLWVGASVHEVAQVVAAAFQGGQEAGEFGTVAKLSRVMLLAPIVLGLGWFARQRLAAAGGGGAKAPAPWFVLGFLLMVVLNSAFAIPVEVKSPLASLTTFLLAMALAAVGLETNLGKLRAKGWRPFALGFAAFLFVSLCGLLLVLSLG